MNNSIRLGILFGLAAGAALAFTDPQPPAKSQDTGVQEAVRWERAKDTAAARQARLELPLAAKTAETKATDGAATDATRWERTSGPGDSGKGNAVNPVATAKTRKK